MKDNLENIEDLFRESFDGFESDVNPDAWNNIAEQIGSQVPAQDPSSVVSSSSSSSGLIGGSAVTALKVAAVAGILSIGGYFMFSGDEEIVAEKLDSAVKEEVVESQSPVKENEQVLIKEDPSSTVIEESISKTKNEVEIESQPEVLNDNVIVQNEQTDHNQPSEIKTNSITTDQASSGAKPVPDILEKPEEKNIDDAGISDLSPEEKIAQKDIFEASIYASVTSGKQPLEVRFENRGTYSNDVHWKFNDGEESNSDSEYHTFEKSGDYWVVLEIRDPQGKVSKDSTKISVQGKAFINATNTFSPNGDGINDAFMVESDYIDQFHCKIFDRNQRLIVEWNSIYGHWDGRDMHDNPAPPGTYFYIIEATDMDGNQLELIKGIVTLFR